MTGFFPPISGLTPKQVEQFNKDGFLVLEGALNPETVESLMVETKSLLDNFSVEDHPKTKFTTGGEDGKDHVGDSYFLESGDKVRFFFEEDAFDDKGQLKFSKNRAINKIGHSLHTHSPFSSLTAPPPPLDVLSNPLSPKYLVQCIPPTPLIAKSLSFQRPEILQSMLILKQPSIGGAVPPHQDSTFLYTTPPSAIGFWFALEDATTENGCLHMLRGSHKWAPITKRFVRKADNSGTEFIPNEGPLFPEGLETTDEPKEQKYEAVPVEAGTLVLIHGNLLHKSSKNTSQKGRVAYTFHVIEGREEGEGPEYDGRNWLQPGKDGFTKLY